MLPHNWIKSIPPFGCPLGYKRSISHQHISVWSLPVRKTIHYNIRGWLQMPCCGNHDARFWWGDAFLTVHTAVRLISSLDPHSLTASVLIVVLFFILPVILKVVIQQGYISGCPFCFPLLQSSSALPTQAVRWQNLRQGGQLPWTGLSAFMYINLKM